jgi:SET domain-containing protein
LTGDAAVFFFLQTHKQDLVCNNEWNTAPMLNQNSSPKIATNVTEKRVFIYALRDIELGEELTFDYGFDLECWEDHPCLCGSDNCIGYIVRNEDWSALEEIKKNRGQELVKELV